jgi:hypothetical protein
MRIGEKRRELAALELSFQRQFDTETSESRVGALLETAELERMMAGESDEEEMGEGEDGYGDGYGEGEGGVDGYGEGGGGGERGGYGEREGHGGRYADGGHGGYEGYGEGDIGAGDIGEGGVDSEDLNRDTLPLHGSVALHSGRMGDNMRDSARSGGSAGSVRGSAGSMRDSVAVRESIASVGRATLVFDAMTGMYLDPKTGRFYEREEPLDGEPLDGEPLGGPLEEEEDTQW